MNGRGFRFALHNWGRASLVTGGGTRFGFNERGRGLILSGWGLVRTLLLLTTPLCNLLLPCERAWLLLLLRFGFGLGG